MLLKHKSLASTSVSSAPKIPYKIFECFSSWNLGWTCTCLSSRLVTSENMYLIQTILKPWLLCLLNLGIQFCRSSVPWPTVVELFKSPWINIKHPWSMRVHHVLLEVLLVFLPFTSPRKLHVYKERIRYGGRREIFQGYILQELKKLVCFLISLYGTFCF